MTRHGGYESGDQPVGATIAPAGAAPGAQHMTNGEELLRPGDVAKLFKVDPKTVTRWCQLGKLESIRTPGGHRRIKRSSVESFMVVVGHG